MKQIGVRELKERATGLLRELQQTKEAMVITRRGKPIAHLVPIEDPDALWRESLAVWEELDRLAQEIGKHLPPGTSSVEAVREQRRDL